MADNDNDSGYKFYKTSPAPCPYLADRFETKILTPLTGSDPENLYMGLLLSGFRRSQTVAYRPICQNCSACQSIRIIVDDFRPNKAQKRILKKNNFLYPKVAPPHLQSYHYDLYEKYIHNRHPDGEMSRMSYKDIESMIEQTTIDTVIVEYRHMDTQEIYGWVLTDLTAFGPSMVYSVYNPEYTKNSLGIYAILQHIEFALQLGTPYLFLGYWIEEDPKMSYKTNFKPYQVHINNKWC